MSDCEECEAMDDQSDPAVETDVDSFLGRMRRDLESSRRSFHFGPFRSFGYAGFNNFEFRLLGFYVDIDVYKPNHFIIGLHDINVGLDSYGAGKYSAWIPVPNLTFGFLLPGFDFAAGFNPQQRPG
jgi:hypothetical protein